MIKFILLFILSFNLYAQVAAPVKLGDKAPISGIIITEDKVKELYKAEQSVIVLKDLRVSDKILIEHYKKDSEKYRKINEKNEFHNNVKNTGYFLLGTILATICFKIVQKGSEL